jgi:hypothetical protein
MLRRGKSLASEPGDLSARWAATFDLTASRPWRQVCPGKRTLPRLDRLVVL